MGLSNKMIVFSFRVILFFSEKGCFITRSSYFIFVTDMGGWSTVYLANYYLSQNPGVQIIWSNSRCHLHTSAALQLQLFVSDLPLNQSEYTVTSLSSNQSRVDHRKWNFNVIFTLAHL